MADTDYSYRGSTLSKEAWDDVYPDLQSLNRERPFQGVIARVVKPVVHKYLQEMTTESDIDDEKAFFYTMIVFNDAIAERSHRDTPALRVNDPAYLEISKLTLQEVLEQEDADRFIHSKYSHGGFAFGDMIAKVGNMTRVCKTLISNKIQDLDDSLEEMKLFSDLVVEASDSVMRDEIPWWGIFKPYLSAEENIDFLDKHIAHITFLQYPAPSEIREVKELPIADRMEYREDLTIRVTGRPPLDGEIVQEIELPMRFDYQGNRVDRDLLRPNFIEGYEGVAPHDDVWIEDKRIARVLRKSLEMSGVYTEVKAQLRNISLELNKDLYDPTDGDEQRQLLYLSSLVGGEMESAILEKADELDKSEDLNQVPVQVRSHIERLHDDMFIELDDTGRTFAAESVVRRFAVPVAHAKKLISQELERRNEVEQEQKQTRSRPGLTR